MMNENEWSEVEQSRAKNIGGMNAEQERSEDANKDVKITLVDLCDHFL